ncbi:restriction endonuclease subunit S [Chitinophaga niabensis]|uniref:Type I restriction-modification system, DNA methylase subunit n=1 Tax=Chitinophaga niabensis TaxID=536979 RepID=A0A1N6JBD3_9BACT|nr:restriction endonuclease subunit S [Chitinophaga niabensis]SIO41543.1 Type I restriction-modification system, DNA methylase subunit [Chitinophaga niabensis]
MITKENFKELLITIGFLGNRDLFTKKYPEIDAYLKVDFKNGKLIYPEDKGLKVNERQTCNFGQNENFVVFECVNRLFEKGYKPNHIELEPKWKLGHGASGGRADIMVKDNSGKSLIIIECKTEGKEFDIAWKKTLINGGQILSYVKQAGSTQFVCLYSSDYQNGKVVWNNYLITLKDNEKLLLELAEKSPLSFEKAKGLDVEDIFKAWSETYQQDFATKGIFEDDIPAYEIGKTKYSLKDLNTISSNDIQGKYHEFATILRQHNVSGRENAFDKLVSLFLCKIVDETNNPEELKFYWKGIAYDDQFSLIDRLQKLYQDGMQRFLGEDVVYISADQIDKAFDFFKNDPDATKDTIKKYFRELKFFNNNDFGFIDVHNEKLFYQNTAILLKIVKMLQDLRLKTDSESASEENQFLGDMFEGFLDQGVKQSEGQFFTPMPIVKFILKSLPLEDIITKRDEIPKVIDFACGAGHFLNEYAKEIKSIVEKQKEGNVTDYYENVFGIEKEYRLSKVAKVSAFMYGQDNINIVYADALSSGKAMDDKNIKDGSFSLLVANPPYSVKGFLETLTETERKKYQLIETVEERSFSSNNSIETFFIERAKQLLKPGGVAGIIVPSSILTKGKAKSTSRSTNIYVATRELLLKYFDIVAIAEFGSGTFGKTGTNTVTLFIRRKKENPAPADHFRNRINAWFNFDKTKDGLFEDEHLLKQYCSHLELKFADYQTLLKGEPNEELLSTEIFKDYQREFDKWSDIQNLKKKSFFKELTKEKQNAEIKRRLASYLIDNEKEKLYYFVLASQNPQKVLIIKSPSKTTEIKEFLGYEWSAAKGNEGIKYLGGIQLGKSEIDDNEDENLELEEDDKRVLSNIFNLNNINTPLYDPKNKLNTEKINYLIHQNFKGEDFEIPESLGSTTIYSDLVDMMNFKLPNFNKSISLSPSSTIKIESKWELKKLSSVVDIISGGTPSTTVAEYWNGTIPWLSVADFNNGNRFVSETEKTITQSGFDNSNTNYLVPDEIILSARGTVGAFAQVAKRMTFNQSCYGLRAKNGITNSYLYYVLGELLMQFKAKAYGSKFDAITVSTFDEILIPVPPPEVQKQIIDTCSAIDKDAENARKSLYDLRKEIQDLFEEAFSKAKTNFRISDTDCFEISIGKRVLKTEINNIGVGIPVYSANVFEPFGHIKKELLESFDVPSVLWGIDGDWMVNYIPENKPFYPTDHCGVLRVKSDKIDPKYLAWVLQKEGERIRFSRTNRASMDSMRSLSVRVPSKEIQSKLIKEVFKREVKIEELQKIIIGIAKRKEVVIKSYLTGVTESEAAKETKSKKAYQKKK